MGSNIGNNGGGDGDNGVWCYVGDRVSVDGGCVFFWSEVVYALTVEIMGVSRGGDEDFQAPWL